MDYFFIGSEELLIAFRFVGVEGVAVDDRADALAAFRGITLGEEAALPAFPVADRPRPRILIITEEIAEYLGETLTDWQLGSEFPLVVEIPGLQGRLPGRKTLVEAIRNAIGIQV